MKCAAIKPCRHGFYGTGAPRCAKPGERKHGKRRPFSTLKAVGTVRKSRRDDTLRRLTAAQYTAFYNMKDRLRGNKTRPFTTPKGAKGREARFIQPKNSHFPKLHYVTQLALRLYIQPHVGRHLPSQLSGFSLAVPRLSWNCSILSAPNVPSACPVLTCCPRCTLTEARLQYTDI